MDWIKKEDDQGFRLEAKFLTHRGVRQELQRSSFIRNPDDIGGFKSYVRYWPGGYHAIARIHPRTRAGRVKVSISYYDSEGTKFHRSPLEGTLSAGKDHRLLIPTQSTSTTGPLSSLAAGLLVHAFAAARAALGKSKYEVWLERQ
jgi:hypothetical protein